MGALKELFGTPVGLLSLASIIGVIAIGVYMSRWINRQIEQDAARQKR